MTDKFVPVITIDGPSGSGKGTVGQCLAQELGWHFLDSGALYRILALAVQKQGISLGQESSRKGSLRHCSLALVQPWTYRSRAATTLRA